MTDASVETTEKAQGAPHRSASRPASRSLSLTLIRSIAFVLVMTILLGSLLTYLQALNKIDTEVSSAIQSAERTVEKALPEIARDEDPRNELVRLVRVFEGNRHVTASLHSAPGAGRDIHSTPAHARNVPAWFVALFPKSPRTITIELPDELRKFGHIELQADTNAEVAEVWNEILLKTAIVLGFCVVLCAVVYGILGRALQPLGDVSEAFERLGTGDYDARIYVRGPAELQRLCEGFNDMAERLSGMEERNQALNDQLATVQEEERSDLARDLHDEVSPFLFSVEVDAASIRSVAEGASKPEGLIEIQHRADAIRDAVAHMKKHVRSILNRLRPTAPLELGLEEAVRVLATSWKTRNSALGFELEIEDTNAGQKIDIVIYGLIREAISNALKHGKATLVRVSVTERKDGGIAVSVVDNGAGIRREKRSGGGFGLVAMKERVSALGGDVTVKNREDGSTGVEVLAYVPGRAQPQGRAA